MNDFSGKLNKTINVIPVVDTIPADLLTPLAVYLKLSAGTTNSFLLESVEGGKNLARYSFIGADPDLVVTGNDVAVIVSDRKGSKHLDVPLMRYLREHFSGLIAESGTDLPPFIGGAIGYLGFDCSSWFESSATEKKNADDAGSAAFMIFRSVVAFDHAKQVIKLITLTIGDGSDPDTKHAAEQANRELREKLENIELKVPPSDTQQTAGPPVSNWDRPQFEAAVDKAKELIRAGEVYQVVLSQRFSRKTKASAISIYRSLRSLNPSPYMFLLQFADRAIVGASPEMLVRCEGGRLEYRPIAGTRPRGKTTDEDKAFAEEMKLDEKEVSEHLMLVDLGRNDLGRVAEFGSVSVDELMKVEKYSHVQHLVSSLSARLSEDRDRFDALAACFPAGTVSGAPKVRAIEIIRDLEPDGRGVYAGAVGYFDYAGNMDTCIAIRTLVLENGAAHIQAGAGIVADSVASAEYTETVNKAAALLKAVDSAELGGLR